LDSARKGKIARCPLAIRQEVNRRLLDGQPASKILPWLNSDEQVLQVLDEHFGEEPVTAQNLSEWRQGGYRDWLKRRENITRTKELATYAAELGQAAGGSLNDGSAAILSGQLLELLEDPNPKTIASVVKSVVMLRDSDLDTRKADQRDRLLEQKERALQLDEKRFEVRSTELFMKYYDDRRAREIVEGKGTKAVKMDQLRLLIFGEKPQTEGGQ
jgi:hypothetical protein